jgi:hypothetical protein
VMSLVPPRRDGELLYFKRLEKWRFSQFLV